MRRLLAPFHGRRDAIPIERGTSGPLSNYRPDEPPPGWAEPLARSDLDLADAIAHRPPEPRDPTPDYHSFRRNEPAGDGLRYGWGGSDQAAFERLWPSEADEAVEELIASYQSMWPYAVPRVFRSRFPHFVDSVKDMIATGEIAAAHPLRYAPDFVLGTALKYGAFDRARRTRTWPDVTPFACRICGVLEEGYAVPERELTKYGSPRYCRQCAVWATIGQQGVSRSTVLTGVGRIADALQRVPDKDFHKEVVAGLPPDDRDRVVAALIVSPNVAYATQVVTGGWIQVLKTAGVVGDAWRTSRGTLCTAADGHRCRSLAERMVDDWLAANRIAHEPEPTYPGSSRRADWLLADGTFVEYAGMLDDTAYAAKLDQKREIARVAGFPLVVLVPEDLPALELRLGRYVRHSS